MMGRRELMVTVVPIPLHSALTASDKTAHLARKTIRLKLLYVYDGMEAQPNCYIPFFHILKWQHNQ